VTVNKDKEKRKLEMEETERMERIQRKNMESKTKMRKIVVRRRITG